MGKREHIYEIIAENIRKERRRLGITQAELAERADVSLDTIKSVENGRRAMSLDTYLNIVHVQLFVRKNKDDKISKEFYYLGRVIATGNAKQFVMPNTDKTAVEIDWELETPVREDIYQYIVNE